MSTELYVLAAGSLKRAFVPLCQAFSEQTGVTIHLDFGPAGLLRERIERGERCDVFASANTAHPQTLCAAGRALETATFAWNRLSITARLSPLTAEADWLDLLANDALRLGTSTPGCDPSGDYTWQLFASIDAQYPGLGRDIMQRAVPLVGGRDTVTVPAGEIASAWLIRQNKTDLFIGYAHYAQALDSTDDLRILDIPRPFNPRCEYQLARLSNARAACLLSDFILSWQGTVFLHQAGFLTSESE